MKRALTTLAVLVALPLLAEEPAKKAETKPAPVTLAPAPAGQQDSPLVAAARRTNRLGKKPTNVITNKNLKKASDAHITTTETQNALNVPPPSGPTLEEQQAARRAAEKKRLEDAQRREAEREARRKAKTSDAAYRAEEGMHDSEEADDEAAGERDLQRANEQKPPQF